MLIYGCGNIGFRHLQGILKLNNNIEIYVYDKSDISLSKVKKRLKKLLQISDLIRINFLISINAIEKNIDLVIVSTSSKDRLNIIRSLISKFNLKFLILEKIAFQSVYQFKQALSLLKKNHIKTWVNCPRRVYKSYQNLIKKYDLRRDMIMIVDGGRWSLASNLIHFLDLFAFISNDNNISLVNQYLSSKVTNSKRKGYLDFGGTMIFKNSKNSLLIVHDDKKTIKPLDIIMTNKNVRISISQNYNSAIIETKRGKWQKKKINFEIENQSDLTKKIIEQILNKSNCGLININKSYKIHKIMLDSFNLHLSSVLKKKIINCPIT